MDSFFDRLVNSFTKAAKTTICGDRQFEYGFKYKNYTVNNYGIETLITTEEYRVKCLKTKIQAVLEVHHKQDGNEVIPFVSESGKSGVKLVSKNETYKVLYRNSSEWVNTFGNMCVTNNKHLIYDFLLYVLTKEIFLEKDRISYENYFKEKQNE